MASEVAVRGGSANPSNRDRLQDEALMIYGKLIYFNTKNENRSAEVRQQASFAPTNSL